MNGEIISEADFFAECVFTIERKPDTVNISGYDFDALTDLALDVYNEFCIKFEIINIEESAAEQLVWMFDVLDTEDMPIDSNLISAEKYPVGTIELVYAFINSDKHPVLFCVGKNK